MPDSSSCRTGPKSTTRPSRISSASSRGAASTTRFALLGASDQTDVSTKTFTVAAVASRSRMTSQNRSYRRGRSLLPGAGVECIRETLHSPCPFWSGRRRLSEVPTATRRRSLSSFACVVPNTSPNRTNLNAPDGAAKFRIGSDAGLLIWLLRSAAPP